MSPAEFFQTMMVLLSPALPFELQGFQHRRANRLLKLDYGHPETHYEVSHHAARRRIEVALHFEGRPEFNAAALAFVRQRMVEVRGGLPQAELEPWDRGWVRIYETFAAEELDGPAAVEAASRLAGYVVTLQPLLEEFWVAQIRRTKAR